MLSDPGRVSGGGSAGAPRPLILTAALDHEAFGWLDGLRRRHFPPERNRLRAHLTMFHALPGERAEAVEEALAEVASGLGPLSAVASEWFLLGRGVAMRIESEGLRAVRADLAGRWRAMLSAQDAGGWRPHVTVQNRVSPDVARELERHLARDHVPRTVTVPALELWHYDGGPWAPAGRFPLQGADETRTSV